MTVNIPLLRKAVEWAEAEAAKPDRYCEWWQASYKLDGEDIGRECETCYCIAGYVVHLNGGLPPDGDYEDYDEIAANLLGIDTDHHNFGSGLFNGDNKIEDVRRIAEQIAAEAGERL